MRLDGQQGLMMLGGQAMIARALLTEGQELAYGAAKFAERAIVVLGEALAIGRVLRRRRDGSRHDQIQRGARTLAKEPFLTWRSSRKQARSQPVI